MRKILFLLLLVPFTSLFPQVIENNGALAIADFPHAEIRHFTFGNYGFDARANAYNPYYYKNPTNFYLNISGQFYMAGERRDAAPFGERAGGLLFDSHGIVSPSLGVQLWSGRFLFGLHYNNDILLSNELTYSTRFEFSDNSGFYAINFVNPKYTVRSNSLQFAVSSKVSKALSASIGLATNSLHYSFEGGNVETVPFEVNFLNNLRYLISLNYRGKDTERKINKFYFLFKSENSKTEMEKGGFYFQDNRFFSWKPTYSLPGILGYGFQLTLPIMKLSVEMRHLFQKKESDKPDGLIDLLPNFRSKGWKHEIVFGGNSYLSRNIRLGALVSYFLDYNIRSPRPVFEESGSDPIGGLEFKNPYSIVLSSEYNLRPLRFRLHYQYSKSILRAEVVRNKRIVTRDFATDTAHYVSIEASYDFSF